jgi:hypothetical protein
MRVNILSRAGSTQPLIPRLVPQKTTPADAQVLSKVSGPGNGDVDIVRSDHAPQSASPTPPGDTEEHVVNVISPATAPANSEDQSPEADFNTEEHKQLLIKLKLNNTRPVTPPSEHPSFGPINFDELIQIAASAKKPKPLTGNSVVKQEFEKTRDLQAPSDPSIRTASPSDPKINKEIERRVDDDRNALEQPLSGLAQEAGQAEVIKDELQSEEQQQVEHKMEVLADDAADVDIHGADDSMHVSDNVEGSSGQSENIAHQSADGEQAGMALQAPEHQGSGKYDKSRAADVLHSDETFMPEDFEMDNEFFSSEDLQPQQYIGDDPEAPQDHQDHQMVDEHNDNASVSNKYRYDEEEESNEAPRELSAEPSNPGFGAQNLWNQRHETFTDPSPFSRLPVNSHPRTSSQNVTGGDFMSFGNPASRPVLQHPTGPYDQNGFSAELCQKQMELRITQLREVKKQFEIDQPTQQTPGSLGFAQNPIGGSFDIPMGPLSYQRAPPSGYQQQALYTPNNMGLQYPNFHPTSYGQTPSISSQMQYPAHGCNVPGRSSMPLSTPTPNNQMLGSFPSPDMTDLG